MNELQRAAHNARARESRDLNHVRDLRNMLQLCGRQIGESDADARWYVLDGQVWRDTDPLDIECVGDYFEFCDRIRAGGLPYFRAVNDFHLDGRLE
jgi:hypothetical protein